VGGKHFAQVIFQMIIFGFNLMQGLLPTLYGAQRGGTAGQFDQCGGSFSGFPQANKPARSAEYSQARFHQRKAKYNTTAAR